MMTLREHCGFVSICLMGVWMSSRSIADGYPMLIKVRAGDERCIRFTIPQHEDAHMIFLGLPGEEEEGKAFDDQLEQFFVEQVYEISKRKETNGDLPSKIPHDIPPGVSFQMQQFTKDVVDGDLETFLKVQIGYKSLEAEKYDLTYFQPTVVSHVLQTLPHMSKSAFDKMKNERGGDDEYESLEGQWLCFDNNENESHGVTVAVDIVLVSEAAKLHKLHKRWGGNIPSEAKLGEQEQQRSLEKERHLTPLEEMLKESNLVAGKVLKEMRKNGARDDRMSRHGDRMDNIVQTFSMISIAVLMSVTYIQISYLKKFFHKMKLM